jgi:hypothetical protein
LPKSRRRWEWHDSEKVLQAEVPIIVLFVFIFILFILFLFFRWPMVPQVSSHEFRSLLFHLLLPGVVLLRETLPSDLELESTSGSDPRVQDVLSHPADLLVILALLHEHVIVVLLLVEQQMDGSRLGALLGVAKLQWQVGHLLADAAVRIGTPDENVDAVVC